MRKCIFIGSPTRRSARASACSAWTWRRMQTSGTVCRVRSRATAANVPAAWLRHMNERVTPRLYIFETEDTKRWTRVPGQFCPYCSDERKKKPNENHEQRGIHWGAATRLAIASYQD